MSNTLAPVTVTSTTPPTMALKHEGEPWVSAKHVCETLGISWNSQHTKLSGKQWATIAMIGTVAEDGKRREMSMVDRRTLTMWLATIDTNRVNEAARPTLEAYQLEATN